MQWSSIYAVFCAFLKLGLTSFGGPIAHIGYFRSEFVDKRQWLSETQFAHTLALCQFLPGPASSQLGFAIGLHRAGFLGAIAAFIAFTAPSAVILILFASQLDALSGGIGQAAIHGLKLLACVVVADAVLSMSKSLCSDWPRRVLALISAIVCLALPSVWTQFGVIILALAMGLAYSFSQTKTSLAFSATAENTVAPNLNEYTFSTLWSICAALFFLVCIALFVLYAQGNASANPLVTLAGQFYQAGALVFGGGHVVLPLLQESPMVQAHISDSQFLSGYGAAQAIPGPMFSFAAYLGWFIPTNTTPAFGAVVALAAMFLPGFLLLIIALPFWRTLASNPIAVLGVNWVNAVVVGILSAALYQPIITSSIASIVDGLIAVLALLLLRHYKVFVLYVGIACVLASIGVYSLHFL